MGNQKEFIAQVEKLKKEFDFACNLAIDINADRLMQLEKIEQLELKLKKCSDFVRDCAEDWDCDSDSHKYNLPCRKCNAEKIYKYLSRQKHSEDNEC